MQKNNDVQYSAICEQGDLGLFAEVLSEADNEAVKKAVAKEERDRKNQ